MTPATSDSMRLRKRAPTASHTPGPDSRGNYWMDCGCMVNGVQQQRCPLHAGARNLLAALKAVMQVAFDGPDTPINIMDYPAWRRGIEAQARAAIAAVQGPR